MERTHKLAVAHAFEASSSVDTLNPKSTEIALLVLTIAISIGETLLPSVLGYGPYISTTTEIASGEAHDLFTTVAGSNVID